MSETQQKNAPEQEQGGDEAETTAEDKPARTTVAADTQFDTVLGAVKAAGKDGITLAELVQTTGLPYRVVHNVTWRLEGSPKQGSTTKPDERKIARVNTDRKVRYAMPRYQPTGAKAPLVMAGKFATTGFQPEDEDAS